MKHKFVLMNARGKITNRIIWGVTGPTGPQGHQGNQCSPGVTGPLPSIYGQTGISVVPKALIGVTGPYAWQGCTGATGPFYPSKLHHFFKINSQGKIYKQYH